MLPKLISTDDELIKSFRKLQSPRDIASLLQIPYSRLVYHIYGLPPDQKYSEFFIPKKSGGARKINAPISAIKIIQKKLAYILSLVYRQKKCVHGFVKGKDILTNAFEHTHKRYVLNVDLLNFFPTINFGRVRGMFMGVPYNFNDEVSTVLAQICCFENSLPQGAPTSPIVSNMICGKMDDELVSVAQAYKCRYTRYADDITFSTSLKAFPQELATMEDNKTVIGKKLEAVIGSNGFVVNSKKVRLLSKYMRQEVTGLTANVFPNIRRKFFNQVRAMLHAWKKYGLKNANTEFNKKYAKTYVLNKPLFRDVLRGKIEYICHIVGRDNKKAKSFLMQFEALDKKDTITRYGLLFQNERHRKLTLSVWILETPSRGLQGTGFWLKGYGLVTCEHVIASDTQAFMASAPHEKHKTRLKKYNRDIDLAILELDVECPRDGENDLVKATHPAVTQDEVHNVGFPNYSERQSLQVFDGKITGTKPWFDRTLLQIDAPIIAGNSGGPLVNSKYEVIGIAVTGADNMNDSLKTEMGVIPIEYLDKL